MITLFDPKTDQPVDVAPEHVEQALTSGALAMRQGQAVNFVDRDGKVGAAATPEELIRAVSLGFRPETGEESRRREVQRDYGDRDLAAFGAAAARGVTFGLSDLALTKLGAVEKETLAGLKEANPYASAAGEIAGVTGSLLLPGGAAGAVGKAVGGATALPRLAARGSQKLAEQVVRQTAQKTLVATALQKAATAGVAGAVEGGLYGAGKLLSDATIHDADVTAEAVLAYTGLGALTGGAFGAGMAGAGSLVSGGLKKTASAARKKFDRTIKDYLDEAADMGAAGASGATPAKMLKAEQRGVLREFGNYANRQWEELGGKTMIARDKTVFLDRLRTVHRAANTRIGNTLKMVDDAGGAVDSVVLRAKLRKQLAELPELNLNAATRAEIQKTIDDIGELAGDGRLSTVAAHRYKHTLGKRSKFDAAVPAEVNEARQQIYFTLREAIDDEIGSVAAATLDDPSLLQAFQSDRRLSRVLYEGEQLVERGRMRDFNATFGLRDVLAGTGGVAAAGPVGALGAVGSKFLRENSDYLTARLAKQAGNLVAVQRAARTVGEVIDDSISKALQVKPPRLSLPAAAASLQATSYGRRAEDDRAALARADEVSRLLARPDELAERIALNLADVETASPEVASQVAVLATRAVQLLHRKAAETMPTPAASSASLQPHLEPRAYDRRSMGRFARYVEAVERPTRVIERLAAGEVSTEGVEVLRELYPSIYQAAQRQIALLAADSKRKLTLQESTRLSLFMQAPTGAMLTSGFIARQQAQFRQPRGGQGPGGTRLSGLHRLQTAESLSTRTTKLEG